MARRGGFFADLDNLAAALKIGDTRPGDVVREVACHCRQRGQETVRKVGPQQLRPVQFHVEGLAGKDRGRQKRERGDTEVTNRTASQVSVSPIGHCHPRRASPDGQHRRYLLRCRYTKPEQEMPPILHWASPGRCRASADVVTQSRREARMHACLVVVLSRDAATSRSHICVVERQRRLRYCC